MKVSVPTREPRNYSHCLRRGGKIQPTEGNILINRSLTCGYYSINKDTFRKDLPIGVRPL